MAAKIVKTTDFVGEYQIQQNSFSTTHLQAFIDKFETSYLYDLLGVSLGNALLADIATPFTAPVTTKYATIFNELNQDNGSCQIRSEGIKKMLVGFIYWEVFRNSKQTNTLAGPITPQVEASKQLTFDETNVYNVYNNSVKIHRAIQIYINNNISDYSNFNGKMKSYNNWFL